MEAESAGMGERAAEQGAAEQAAAEQAAAEHPAEEHPAELFIFIFILIWGGKQSVGVVGTAMT